MTFAGRPAGRLVDGAVVIASACAGILVAFDWNVPSRTLWATVLVAFGPGWTLLRWWGARLELFTFLLAAALSVSYTMLTTLVLTTRLGWAWQACAVVTSFGCVAGLVATMRRRRTAADGVMTDRPANHDSHAAPLRERVRLAGRRGVFGVTGLAIAVVGIARTDVDRIGGMGLIDAVPRWYFIGTALLVVGVLDNLRPGVHRSVAAAWAHLVALIVAFHGVAAFAEPNPRFPVAWLHVAFANHLADGGPLLQTADARFSWPGFFTAAGYLERVAGTDTVLWALALAPIVINIVTAALIYDLGLTLGLTRFRSTLASLVFVLTNWIGQDYFAPQAVAFLMVLVIVDLVLRNLSTQPRGNHWLSRCVGTHTAPARPFGDGSFRVTYGIVLTLSAALIVSHQLSPVMLVCIFAGLALVQRAATYRLTAVVALGFVGWLSYVAESYWIGHSEIIFGSIGDMSTMVSTNVTERSQPGGGSRQTIVRLRMLTMLAVWLLACIQIILLRRRRRLDAALAVMLVAPAVPFLLQPYGGEGLLRTALFTLPAASMLIASVELSEVAARRRVRLAFAAALTCAALAAAPLLMVTRYGNESYERVTDDDLALYEAVAEILDRRDRGEDGEIRLFTFSQPSPLLIGRMEYYNSVLRLPRVPERAVGALNQQLLSGHDVFVVLVGSHIVERQQVDGFPEGWRDAYLAELRELVHLDFVARTDNGTVLSVREGDRP